MRELTALVRLQELERGVDFRGLEALPGLKTRQLLHVNDRQLLPAGRQRTAWHDKSIGVQEAAEIPIAHHEAQLRTFQPGDGLTLLNFQENDSGVPARDLCVTHLRKLLQLLPHLN